MASAMQSTQFDTLCGSSKPSSRPIRRRCRPTHRAFVKLDSGLRVGGKAAYPRGSPVKYKRCCGNPRSRRLKKQNIEKQTRRS